MRLSDIERRALAHAMDGIDYVVEIFGSRIDDAARGGDIDLLVLAPGLAADERLRLSLRMAVAFRSVCDEKNRCSRARSARPHGRRAGISGRDSQ